MTNLFIDAAARLAAAAFQNAAANGQAVA